MLNEGVEVDHMRAGTAGDTGAEQGIFKRDDWRQWQIAETIMCKVYGVPAGGLLWFEAAQNIYLGLWVHCDMLTCRIRNEVYTALPAFSVNHGTMQNPYFLVYWSVNFQITEYHWHCFL